MAKYALLRIAARLPPAHDLLIYSIDQEDLMTDISLRRHAAAIALVALLLGSVAAAAEAREYAQEHPGSGVQRILDPAAHKKDSPEAVIKKGIVRTEAGIRKGIVRTGS